MKRQTRYKTEKEIIAAIDHCHLTATEQMKLAETLEDSAREFYRKSAELAESNNEKEQCQARGFKLEGDKAKDKSFKCRKRATRLLEVKAKKLGKALSDFLTGTMGSVVGNDRSVVMT